MKLRSILAVLTLLALSAPALAAQGSGCMPTTGIVSGLTMTQDINAGFAALISSNSGNSAPTTDCSAAPVKGQFWLDTSVTPNVLKQYDGTSWTVLGALDAANHLWAPPVGGGTASIAAASTTDICAAPAAVQTITGTTTITGFGSSCAARGIRKTLIFNSATPLTHNATSLFVPGQQNYTTSPGDLADAIYLGSGNWRIASITKADGSAVTNPAIPLGTAIYGIYGTQPAKTVYGAGQAISRASYPAYFAAVTRTQSGTLTAGNNTIASVSNTAGLGAGMPVEGTGIQAGTVISSVTSSTIVMSKTATANGSQSISVIIPGYGSGGDSTTVGVLDCRGRTLAGRDDMLGTAANNLTSGYFGTSAAVLNAAGGNQSVTMALGNMIAHQHSVYLKDPGHTHPEKIPYLGGGTIYLATAGGAAGSNAFAGPLTDSATTGITIGSVNGVANDNQTATAGSASPTPMRTVPPTAIAECVVAVLP